MFLERVLFLINERGITKNKLLVTLNLSKNSFVDWDKRGSIPSGETLAQIADYFGVSTDYLLGRTDKKGPATETGGEPSKAELVFRALPPEKQEEALRYMEYLAEHKGK